jgi:hypothetical protein
VHVRYRVLTTSHLYGNVSEMKRCFSNGRYKDNATNGLESYKMPIDLNTNLNLNYEIYFTMNAHFWTCSQNKKV